MKYRMSEGLANNGEVLKEAMERTPRPKEALSQPEQEPLATPLPCDVKVGHVTIRKGVALSVLVARMQVLYDMVQTTLPQPEQEPWGACLSGRVFVGKLPEHVRRLAKDNGLTIQWLYTTPPQRKTCNCDQLSETFKAKHGL